MARPWTPPPTTSTSNVFSVSRSRSRSTRNSIVSSVATTDEVRDYWERHIHDLEITRHAVASRGFFEDLDQYHFEKLHHLPRLVDFAGYAGKSVLEVGCGAGVDLVRFAKGGSPTARACRLPAARSIWSTRTASCSTPPIPGVWLKNVAGC